MKKQIITAVAVVAAICALFFGTAPRNAAELNERTVDILDSVNFDGQSLNFTYTVQSQCPASSHSSFAEVAPIIKDKYVTGFKVEIIDAAYESKCGNKLGQVTVSGKQNLAEIVRVQLEKQSAKGIRPAPDATLQLPSVKISKNDGEGAAQPVVEAKPKVPEYAVVESMEYSMAWHCNLDKRSAAKRNNFDGYGSTEAEARRDASQKCAVTNAVNPNCSEMSISPKHTTCDVQLQEKPVLKQYRYNELPANAAENGWSCGLNQGGNSLFGKGRTIEEARADAAKKCKGVGRRDCDIFSGDNEQAACMPLFTSNAQKPNMEWTCVLDKRSAAKRNVFTGYGATREAARIEAAQRCAVTNAVNPNCSEMSLHPNHTSCSVELTPAR